MRGKSKDSDANPVDEFVPELRELGLAYVRRHLSDRPAEHEDLVHDAILGVCEWTRGKPGVPREDARRLTIAVLKRRVADLFREQARSWARQDVPEPIDPGRDPRDVLISRAVRATVGFLAEANEDDRMLVALLVGKGDRALDHPLSQAERKRLQRLRQRLRVYLIETLGESVAEILEHEPE